MSSELSVGDQLVSWMTFSSKLIGSIGLFVTVMLYVFQDNLLYIPNPPGFPKTPDDNPVGHRTPGEWGIDGKQLEIGTEAITFEDNMLTTSDGERIHTWLLLQDKAETAPTVIYFHGNAGNMGFRLQNAAEMYARVGVNVLMMDYRGYGKSSGKPSEKGIREDARIVLNYAVNHPRLKNSPMVPFGRSLGGAVSIWLASEFPGLVDAVIVENTFLSVSAMVDVLLPYVKYLKGIVLRIKWDSDVKIRSLLQPIFFISGDSDELVPPFHMTKLRDLAGKSKDKDFFSVKEGTHNDTWLRAGSTYYRRMKAFLGRTVNAKSAAPQNEDNCGDNESNIAKPVISLPTMSTSFTVR